MNVNDLARKITEGVSDRIATKEVALQFVLEELDAARQGNDAAIQFVNNSGFSASEYEGAMQNSFEEVDGANGPQQFLLSSVMAYSSDMDFMVNLRLQVVKNIIDEWSLTNQDDGRVENLMQSLKKILEDDEAVMPELTTNIAVPDKAQARHIHFREKNITSAKNILSTIIEITGDDADTIINKSLGNEQEVNEEDDSWLEDWINEESEGIDSEDYELLKEAPFIVFILMALADGEIDLKETTALAKVILDPSAFKNDFLVQVIRDAIPDITPTSIPECLAPIMNNGPDYLNKLQELKRAIDENLDASEALQFKQALIKLGYKIADASGGLFGLGSRVCKQEEQMLRTIAKVLGVTGV